MPGCCTYEHSAFFIFLLLSLIQGNKDGIVKLLFFIFVFSGKLTIFAQKMKYDEIHRLARQNGWEVLRQYHQGKEMGKGLERKIKKEMHLV